MSRYIETANRYSTLPGELLKLVPDEHKIEVALLLPRLVNAGVTSVPRACQSTVRLNIVREICKHIPVVCSLEERTTEDGNHVYKALVVRER